MRILIIGEGGRESALAAKLQNDPRISKMFFANGNATTDVIGKNVHLSEIKELRDFAIKEKVDLTIVGPEAPLVAGLKDEFKNTILKFSALLRKWQAWKEVRLFLRNLCRPMISKQLKR